MINLLNFKCFIFQPPFAPVLLVASVTPWCLADPSGGQGPSTGGDSNKRENVPLQSNMTLTEIKEKYG